MIKKFIKKKRTIKKDKKIWEKNGKNEKNALKLYKEKMNNPSPNISNKYCDFKILEEKGKLYNKKE